MHYMLSIDPGIAAFAHGGGSETNNNNIGASFLDLVSGATVSIRDKWSHSESMCLQFRTKGSSGSSQNSILFGHRDGSVSMIDTRCRANDALFAKSAASLPGSLSSFGSATSIQPLQRDDNLVVVKGSFGPCRVLDFRRFGGTISYNSSRRSSSRHQQSATLLELSIPDSLDHHQTKSVRCTGLAIDPTENVVIAPFASTQQEGSGDNIQFALWDLNNGDFLRALDLNNSNDNTKNSAGGPLAAFCELSNVTTCGYEMICARDSDEPMVSSKDSLWGLWFKTNVLSDSTSQDSGGIHHLMF